MVRCFVSRFQSMNFKSDKVPNRKLPPLARLTLSIKLISSCYMYKTYNNTHTHTVHTHSRTRPGSSATTPSFLHAVHRCWEGSEWKLAYPIMAWRQGATPPGGEPADRASHLGSREPATGPSIAVPCPLGLQPARQTGRAGGDQRSSLTRQAGMCFDDSSIQWGQKWPRFTLFNAVGWFQTHSLTGHRCIPTVAFRP